MIRFQRSAKAKGGKFPQAILFAKEITEYLNTNYSAASIQVFAEQFGNTGTIYWCVDYEDLATIDGVNAQLMGDQEYWALVSKSPEFFIEGSIKDTLMGAV